MRVPMQWLTEYCAPDLDVAGVQERLTMTGTKVEAVHHHGVAELDHFVVGRVLACAAHPDADRLSVCRVDVGDGQPAEIVCGAPNVATGQTVAVARPGAVMPDGTRLRSARLRGVVSDGMILAEDELAIGVEHAGIMVLDDLFVDAEIAPGAPLGDVLQIATEVLELEVTPNRPDCLGVFGVARELHAATGAPLSPPPWADDPGTAGPIAGVEVLIDCPRLCPRFTARLFEEVTVAPSPPWLKARLSAAGQRPINNVVDITNYVMLLTAQPMHAFDFDRVAGGRLEVRQAGAQETVQTLDGQTRTLDADMVLIADEQGPTSIAGVMGGSRSEVGADTSRVLLEAATWDGPSIHRTSWALGLRSEASGRFEKGLAPEQAMYAQAVATRLMVQVCGARAATGTSDVGGPGPAPARLRLRERHVLQTLGAPIGRERQAEILGALDFESVRVDGGLEVSVPPLRRTDVTREADLIEEVSRIDGLDRLPVTLPKRRGAYGRLSREQRLRRRAVDALVGRGLHEVMGWTFCAPALADRLRLDLNDERRRAVAVQNPLSADQNLLRPTLLGSLLDVAAHNVARGLGDLALFEVGTVFAERPGAPLPHEHQSLAILLRGHVTPLTWAQPQTPRADFFTVKAMLEALGAALRVGLELVPGAQAFLHPGRSAHICAQGESVGWLGELHPLVARTWDVHGAGAAQTGLAVLEVDLDRLIAVTPPVCEYVDLISYPALRQDLAVILPADVPASDVLATVRSAAGSLLDHVAVFDVYAGPQVGEGRRSLALALSFRAPERTLTDEDVAPVRERVVAALANALGGELRA